MKYYKKMIGDNIYLSPINVEDEETYIKWLNDEVVAINYAHTQYCSVISSKEELSWLFLPQKGIQRYAIVMIDGDILIGSVGLHDINHHNRNAFMGIFIGEEEYRNRGYGTEAVRLILNYGFKTLNLHNIMLSAHADNDNGIACYKKVGFSEAGRFRDRVFKNGEYVDVIYMEILEHEFNM